MRVPGNEELGVLSQPLLQRQMSSNYYGTIPIKKRRFPIISPPSPEETLFNSEDNKSKDRQEPGQPDQGLSINAGEDSAKLDVSKLIAKTEHVTDTTEKLAQANVDISISKPQEAKRCTSLGPLLNEKSAVPEIPGSSVGANIVNVKQEIVSGKNEVKLPTRTRNFQFAVGAKELSVHALEHQNIDSICQVSGKSDSLLRFSLSQEKLVSDDKTDGIISNVRTQVCANRSNWDLNTTMDVWEGSVNDLHTHRTDVSGFSKINIGQDFKSSSSAVCVILDKGKQVIDEHSFNYSITSVQQYKPDDNLHLSLAMSCRDCNDNGKQSSLSNSSKSDGQLNLGQLQMSTVNLPSENGRAVITEPVNENSRHDCSTDSSSIMKLSQFGSVKREFIENHESETVSVSGISSPKIIDNKPIKPEFVQSIGKVTQSQETTAFSNVPPMPLTPPSSCLSKLSTFLELPISGHLSNQSEHSSQCKEHTIMVSKSVTSCGKQLQVQKEENMDAQDCGKCKQIPLDEQIQDSQNGELIAHDEEKINISGEILEEDSFGSDANHDSVTHVDNEEKLCNNEKEVEDGEVQESLQHSTSEDSMIEEETENAELVKSDSGDVFLSGEQNTNSSDFDGKFTVTENHGETSSDQINKKLVMGLKELKSKNSSPQNTRSNKVTETGTQAKKSISFTPDLSGIKEGDKDGYEEESSKATNESHGIETLRGGVACNRVVEESCPGKHDSTLSKPEASVNDDSTAQDSNNLANKRRVINLPRASVMTTPGKAKTPPCRSFTSRSGKERYSDHERETHPRGKRYESFSRNKFVKDRAHDQPLRNNSRPRLGKERASDHDYASETFNDYRIARRKNSSCNAPDVDLDCNGYYTGPDGYRRKTMNEHLPFNRVSREGPTTRGEFEMLRRFPKNISPIRSSVVFSRSLTMYDELDGHFPQGDMNFPTNARKDYSRIRSKSPIRSRARSPNGVQELTRDRSPIMYRIGRMRSPERLWYRDEMISRRRSSPSNLDDYAIPRSVNSCKRSPPERFFLRNARRTDSDECSEIRDDGRKFSERQGLNRSLRPNYRGGIGNFNSPPNNGPRDHRFCPDSDTEFVERSEIREREFDVHMKHEASGFSRRIRNMVEQSDGNQRPSERVWHDEGSSDVSRLKRKRI